MRYMLLSLLVCFLMGCHKRHPAGTPVPPKAMQIYLLMGQSNMTGDTSLGIPATSASDSRIHMYKNGTWQIAIEPVNQQSYAGYGPSMAFAFEMIRFNPSTEIGLVNCAVGGSPISSWLPGQEHLETCLAQLAEAKKAGEFAGVIFMQGEADAVLHTETWPSDFNSMIAYLRAKTGSSVPVAYGQIGAIRNADPIYNDFRSQQASVASSSIHMVVTYDLPIMDAYHFTKEAYDELGKRFARAISPYAPLDSGVLGIF